MDNKLSEERKEYEQKITTYKAAMEQEMLNLKNKLSILEPFSFAAFNFSEILTTEAQRKFVQSLFVGMVFSGHVTRMYKASEHGFAAS